MDDVEYLKMLKAENKAARKKKKPRESTIEETFVEWCKSQGYYTRKFTSPGSSGVPDRVIVGPRRTVFLELKRPGGKPTVLQCAEIAAINSAGGHAAWTDSLDEAKLLCSLYA